MVNLQIIGYNTIKMSISWKIYLIVNCQWLMRDELGVGSWKWEDDRRPKTEENEELKKKANS